MRRLMQTIIALPSIASSRRLEMLHQIGGDERDALRIADQRLQRGPLRLELLLLRQLLAFGDLVELLVDLRQLGLRSGPAWRCGSRNRSAPSPCRRRRAGCRRC